MSQGPTGPQGVQGLQGPQGIQGIQGVAGATGIQGPQGLQGPGAGSTGPTGAAGSGGGFTPAGGQFNWTNSFLPTTTNGSASLLATRNPQSTQSVVGISYTNTSGVFSTTGTNTGTYYVSVSIIWTCSFAFQFVPFQLRTGTTIPGSTISSRATVQQNLAYNGLAGDGDPVLFPAFGQQTQTVLTAIVPLTTTDTRIGIYANTDGNQLTIYEMIWTLHRIA